MPTYPIAKSVWNQWPEIFGELARSVAPVQIEGSTLVAACDPGAVQRISAAAREFMEVLTHFDGRMGKVERVKFVLDPPTLARMAEHPVLNPIEVIWEQKRFLIYRRRGKVFVAMPYHVRHLCKQIGPGEFDREERAWPIREEQVEEAIRVAEGYIASLPSFDDILRYSARDIRDTIEGIVAERVSFFTERYMLSEGEAHRLATAAVVEAGRVMQRQEEEADAIG